MSDEKVTAKDLQRGDVFRMHVYGEVIAVEPVAGGKRMKVRIALENQGGRSNGGALNNHPGAGDVEFTDEGSTLEFLCKPGRTFHVHERDVDDDDDDGDGENEPVEPSSPTMEWV
jgi:hypothetical protein